ncbi:MAG: WD40 repeat domain-containing protein [Ignavibacteriae bacterium]|nr:WD40 repeat domain-containing protein [Ignavibacteriota bacterium]
MRTALFSLFTLLLLLVISVQDSSKLSAQTVFEDAAAQIFKQSGSYSAAIFNANNTLMTARFVQKDGDFFAEVGTFDEKGFFTLINLIELKTDPSEVKIKFNPSLNEIGVNEISSDKNKLYIYDINSGKKIQDFDPQPVDNFFFTPDGKSVVISSGGNSTLFDVAEGDAIISYGTNTALGISKNGSTLFCRNSNGTISYIDIKTAKEIRNFSVKDFKSIEFDNTGELMLCLYPGAIKLFKLTQESVVQVKEIDKTSIQPSASSTFEYFVSNDNSAGIRNVYNLGGVRIYTAKIEPYSYGKEYFSADDKRMAFLTEKNIYLYDLEMIKYFGKLTKKYPDLFVANVEFETATDQEYRASRVKLAKNDMLGNIVSQAQVSENMIYDAKKNSFGVVEVKVNSVGNYDPNTEMYDISIDIPVNYTSFFPLNTKVKVPKYTAEVFRNNWQKFKAYAYRQLNNDLDKVNTFNVIIINDLNNVVYKCLMHRTLPVSRLSYDEQFTAAEKSFNMRNLYDAIVYLTDYPEDFKKNSTVDYMMKQALSAFLDEKWSSINTTNYNNDYLKALINLSDIPKTFPKYADVAKMRQYVVNNIMDTRLEKVNDLVRANNYPDALDYFNANVTPNFKDDYSGQVLDYEYFNSKAVPVKNAVLHHLGRKSIEGGNWKRAVEMLSQVSSDYADYADVEKLLSEARNQQ